MIATGWMDGTIRRPAAEFLDSTQFRKLFDLSDDMLREFVERGILPPPVKVNARTISYTWRHAALLALRFEMNWLPVAAKE